MERSSAGVGAKGALLAARVLLLAMKLANGFLCLVVLHMKGTDVVTLAILTGFQWLGFLIHLCILLIHSQNNLFLWCPTLVEVPALGVGLWWINRVLLTARNMTNQTNRDFETTLATLVIVSSCLGCFLRPDLGITEEFGNTPLIDTPGLLHRLILTKPKQEAASDPTTNSSSATKEQLIGDSSHSITNSLKDLPLMNPLILPETPPQSHTHFIPPALPPIIFPTFEHENQNENENENDIHSLNIPQISSSPIRKVPSLNSYIPDVLEEEEDMVRDDYYHTNAILNSYAELEDDDEEDNLYDTLNKEIKSNVSVVRHQSSVPNLPSEISNSRVHIVRHSRSHSLINDVNSGKHSRTSSHSPIKKLGKSFKDSFSVEEPSSHFHNHTSPEFELNMDLVKSIQKSPKKKRSLNHSRLPSINEPIKNPILLSFDAPSNEKRVASNSSIPDGYFSAYDREKWQTLKNML